MMERAVIYADNNATTAVAPEVGEAMGPDWGGEVFGASAVEEPAVWEVCREMGRRG